MILRHKKLLGLVSLFVLLSSCRDKRSPDKSEIQSSDSLTIGTYAYDVNFLKKHTKTVLELADSTGSSKILLSADYQGRVMTSTAAGDSGNSYGWINYALVSAPEKKAQFNAVGGEERFWLGPEGGQYSIYFKAKDSFDIKHWQVPALIDTLPYDVISSDKSSVVFGKKAAITNYSGTSFDLSIERAISLVSRDALQNKLEISIPPGIKIVGYETKNQVTNSGNADWSKDKGLLSIWLLGMFTPTPQTVVIIPFVPGNDSRSMITDNYFGTIPTDRLQVKDSVLYLTCDGKSRGKIGLSPKIAKPIAGSFDFKNNVLTLVLPTIEKQGMYVNSKWEIQKEPYKGDVINSYNDGPLADGTQLGPFYEIESSSPAKELKKGEKMEYRQVTCHLQGDFTALNEIVKRLLFTDLNAIKR